MLQQYHSELGETKQFEMLAVYRPLTNKFKLYTNIKLTGQGIKCDDETGKNNHLNKPSYIVTIKAFEKICKKYNVSQELFFD